MDKEMAFILAVPVFIIVLLLGVVIWSSQDFANRCERAGGILLTYKVCVEADTTVLMVGS